MRQSDVKYVNLPQHGEWLYSPEELAASSRRGIDQDKPEAVFAECLEKVVTPDHLISLSKHLLNGETHFMQNARRGKPSFSEQN